MRTESDLRNGSLTMTKTTSPKQPKRYGRSPEARRLRTARGFRITAHLWPDAMTQLEKHCHDHNLTISGGTHDILRRFFDLNPLI